MNPTLIASERERERARAGAVETAEDLELPVRTGSDRPGSPSLLPRRLLPAGRRPWLIAFVAGGLLALVAVAAGFAVYEYTESSSFCYSNCHAMKPEATVYQQQSHSNIACATCHVGDGAYYFLRSKLYGTRELLATLTNSYERPVASPVENLRPARETCETCHRPEKFTSDVVKLHSRFEEDEQNTQNAVLLILKLGGYDRTTDRSKGIHWHIKGKLYYIAADEQRQEMQWVGVEDDKGKLTEYWSPDIGMMKGNDFVATARAEGRLRLLDCIDCHNRTAHLIEPPATLVDNALAADQLDRNLPYIKKKSVELLSGEYPSQEAGVAAMAGLEEYYRTRYPDVYRRNRESIDRAVALLQDIYRKTNFPDMKLDWQTYPNNVNHRDFKGCSRCHDDRLRRYDEQGRVAGKISGACNLCHSVPVITRPDGPQARVEPTLSSAGLEFLVRDSSGTVLTGPNDRDPIDLTKPGGSKPLAAAGVSSPRAPGNVSLVGPPLVAAPLPESHRDPDYSLSHRDMPEKDRPTCAACHTVESSTPGGNFCDSCHNSSPPHPRDILFSHARIIRTEEQKGGLACSTCHQQNLSCGRCHRGDVVGAQTKTAFRPPAAPTGLP